MNVHTPSEPMSPDALEAALRAIGPVRYHDLHPFHGLLHDGKLNKGQVQAWALNRFVYQSAIPRKDASLIARCEDRELRREWVHRITDHDGAGGFSPPLHPADYAALAIPRRTYCRMPPCW